MSTLSQRPASAADWLLLAGFIVLVLGVGALSGLAVDPGGWYATLNKPPFTPPNWLFGPVWGVLYVLIGIAGWRTWRAGGWSGRMQLWSGQMLLNWAWTPVWFGLHLTWLAFAIIVALVAAIIAFIVASWSRDRVSALLFAPYAAWTGFASLLNLSVALLN